MHEINQRKKDAEKQAQFEKDHPTGKKVLKLHKIRLDIRTVKEGHPWEIAEKQRLAEEAEAKRLVEEDLKKKEG